MDESKLKSEFKKLWKNTFHDSDEYINIIADNYFNTRYLVYEEKGGEIISMLLGVPYNFSGTVDNGYHKDSKIIKGLYLCGLSTKSEFRGTGIMSRLIENINSVAADDDFAFTFLIPANEGLARYYSDRNYVTIFKRYESRFAIGHIFINNKKSSDYNYSYSNIIFSEPNEENIASLINYLMNKERESDAITLQHSTQDYETIIAENRISGGKIIIAENETADIIGAVVIRSVEEDSVEIPYIVYESDLIRDHLLKYVSSLFKNRSIEIKTSNIIFQTEAIDNEYYTSEVYLIRQREVVSCNSQNCKPYGMLRLTRADIIIKYIASIYPSKSFKVILKNGADLIDIYTVSDAEVKVDSVEKSEFVHSSEGREEIPITLKQLTNIIWRSNAGKSDDVFDIPSLKAGLWLMLD